MKKNEAVVGGDYRLIEACFRQSGQSSNDLAYQNRNHLENLVRGFVGDGIYVAGTDDEQPNLVSNLHLLLTKQIVQFDITA